MKTAIEKLRQIGVDEKDLLGLSDGKLLSAEGLAEMHTWKELEHLEGWVDSLKEHAVFFSSPLDVDLAMIAAFPDAYGNLYTAMNREVLKNRIAYYVSRWKEKKQCRIKWMPPVGWMWGRDTQFTDLLNEAEDYVEKRGALHSWDIGSLGILYCEPMVQRATRRASVSGGFFRTATQSKSAPPRGESPEVDERLELCVFFDEFMVALCHLSTKGSPGVFVPVGFMSAQREHVEIAKRIITAVSHS